MEWASPYVYEGHSEEEEVSEGELEEGMWLSDSDDDEPPQPPPPPRTERRAGFLGRLFKRAQTGRKSGAPPPPDDDDSSGEEDSEDEDEQRKGLPRVSGYADLSFPAPPLRQESDDSQLSSPLPSMASSIDTSGANADVDREKDSIEMEVSPGKYAQLAEFQQEMKDKNTSDKIPTAPMVQPPNNQPGEAAVPSPPPPPPPTAPIKQLRGIMKGELKKQKRQRVRWDKSYKSKHRDGSSQGIRTRRPDTNILVVKFNTLRETGHLHTGDAQFCSNPDCGSIVSHLTKLVGEEDDEKKLWTCEFCGTTTELEIVPEEIPTEEDTTYLITPAGVIAEEGRSVGGAGTDESLVVFCIDTSGSMCVTTEVPGRYDLRGAKEKHEKLLQSLPTDVAADLRQPEYRFMQGNSRNVTHISRMESLQAAIDSQLARLAHSEPNKRACLVTFSDDVTIIGDGRMTPVTIAGDKLSDSKAIIDVGRAISLPATIRETQRALSKKVFSLEESGQTALGPAVLVSVVVASQKPGSKVVICTDGLANVGLGSLDVVASNDKSYAAAENFYEDLGDIAMDKGVTVSLLSIEGSDCRVVELGQVANRTGGQVTMVNPLTVTEEFGSILNNPVIATDVVSKIIVHHDMYFRNEDTKDSVIIKQVGNVTADSELTYEYGVQSSKKTTKNDKAPASEQGGGEDVKSKAQTGATAGASPLVEKDVPPQMVDGQPHLPFQLQIEYTNSDGDRCLRVITKTKPVTQDRKLAEKEMDAGIIGSHVAKQAAELTMQGEFTKARVKSLATQKLLQEHSRTSASRRWEYTTYCANMIPLENELHEMQINESSRGRNYSDDEYEEDFYERGSELMGTSFSAPKLQKSTITPQQHFPHAQSAPMAPSRPHVRKSKEAHRRREMSDNLAYGLYGLKTASSDAFRSPSTIVQPRSVTVPHIPPSLKREEPPSSFSLVQPRSVTVPHIPPKPKETPMTIPSPVDQEEPKPQQEPPK